MRSLCIGLLVTAICASAQTPAPASAPRNSASATDSRPDVRQLLEIMHSRQQMEVAINGMMEQFKRGQYLGLEESLRQKGVELSPAQMQKAREAMDGMAEDIFKNMPFDEMLNATAEIYARHLSPEETKAMLAFYQSPAGQKYLAEMPDILQESMRAGGDIMKARVPELTRQADARMQQLINELTAAQSTSPPPKEPVPAPKQPAPKK